MVPIRAQSSSDGLGLVPPKNSSALVGGVTCGDKARAAKTRPTIINVWANRSCGFIRWHYLVLALRAVSHGGNEGHSIGESNRVQLLAEQPVRRLCRAHNQGCQSRDHSNGACDHGHYPDRAAEVACFSAYGLWCDLGRDLLRYEPDQRSRRHRGDVDKMTGAAQLQ